MSLVCVCSAHGSPGATTTALAVAGAWPEGRRCLFVEADPFGGVVAARFGLHDAPGLASLAAAGRTGLDSEMVERHTQQLPGGVPVLVGPPSAEHAHAVLRDLASLLGDWAAGADDLDVVADCGRVAPGSPTVDLLVRADTVLVATRPTVDQLRSAAHRTKSLDAAGASVSLLLVGDQPYGPKEASSALQVPVFGVMAWDTDAADALSGGGSSGGDLRLSRLVRSAATLADQLAADPSGVANAGLVEPQPAAQVASTSGEAPL